jgi:Flp pilus assembly protein protease CpaA
MFELLLLAITLIGSSAAGLYDLKTSNIPDKLCILMIVAGLAIHTYTGFITGDYNILISSLMTGGLFLAFGIIMYVTGQWGGGDGELLVAIGVLVPSLSLARTYFPFAVSFFINSFFVGAVYSVIYSVVLASRNPEITRKFVKSINHPKFLMLVVSLAALAIVSFSYSKVLSFLFFMSMTLALFWKFAKTIDKGFYRRISTSKLKVDDMIGEDIPRLKIHKNLIRGLTKEEVRKIKRMKKFVMIKEGIRYGLVFPLSLLFTLFFGDIFLLLV